MSQELTKGIAAPLALTMPEEEREEALAAFQTNCAGGALTPFDLPRIKMASGTALWLIPGLEGETTAPSIECVVLLKQHTRAFFPSKDAGNTPPVCSSMDAITGNGKPGGRCKSCPLASFDPESNATPGCKENLRLFVLRGTSVLPEVISIPQTSVRPTARYFLQLATQRRQLHHCILRIELEKAQNPQGKTYGKAVIRYVRDLSPEECTTADRMRAMAVPFIEADSFGPAE